MKDCNEQSCAILSGCHPLTKTQDSAKFFRTQPEGDIVSTLWEVAWRPRLHGVLADRWLQYVTSPALEIGEPHCPSYP